MSFWKASGMPRLCSAFHKACLSTESKAALMSRYATFSGQANSWCKSDNRRNANMASIVEQLATKPDCSGRRVMSTSGCNR